MKTTKKSVTKIIQILRHTHTHICVSTTHKSKTYYFGTYNIVTPLRIY